MSEEEKKIMNAISQALPGLDQHQKEKFLSFTEGMAAMAQIQKDRQQDEAPR